MKKRFIIPLAVLTLTLAGCAKERHCKCTIDSVATTHEPVMVVDGGMRCSDITEMAIEVHVNHSFQRTEVHKVTCRDQAQ